MKQEIKPVKQEIKPVKQEIKYAQCGDYEYILPQGFKATKGIIEPSEDSDNVRIDRYVRIDKHNIGPINNICCVAEQNKGSYNKPRLHTKALIQDQILEDGWLDLSSPYELLKGYKCDAKIGDEGEVKGEFKVYLLGYTTLNEQKKHEERLTTHVVMEANGENNKYDTLLAINIDEAKYWDEPNSVIQKRMCDEAGKLISTMRRKNKASTKGLAQESGHKASVEKTLGKKSLHQKRGAKKQQRVV